MQENMQDEFSKKSKLHQHNIIVQNKIKIVG